MASSEDQIVVHEIAYHPALRDTPRERLTRIVGKPVVAFVTVAETADGEIWVVDPPEQDPRFTPNLLRAVGRLVHKLGCRRFSA